MGSRILIAGIGNIFLGDDAFGVEVLRRLVQQPLPDDVRAVDFGIRGFDLACTILDGYDAVILVDASPRGGTPGTLYVIEPDLDSLAADNSVPQLDGHSLNPARVLESVLALCGPVPRIRLVGCEPATFGSDDQPQMGLSLAVAEAVERAVLLVRSLVEEFSSKSARPADLREVRSPRVGACDA
jgi:hydrogenase maturation protease